MSVHRIIGVAFLSLIMSSLAFAQEGLEEAREHIERAEAFFARQDFEAALVEFERAYEAAGEHESRPLVLYNLGRCYEELHRYREALLHYERYLREAAVADDERVEVEAVVRTLSRMLARVSIEVDNEADVWVDDELVGTAPGEVFLQSGMHRLELRRDGFVTVTRELTVSARHDQTIRVELVPIERVRPPLSRAVFWTSTAATLVLAATASTFGVLALSNEASIRRRLDDPVERWAVTGDDVSRVESFAALADGLWIGALVMAATSTVIAFLTDWHAGDEHVAEANSARRWF